MIKLTSTIYKAGTPLSNGNTIDSSLMKQMVNDFNEHFQNEQINYYHYGTFSENSFPLNVNFEDITHKINNVYIKDNRIMADIDILDTPKGKAIQELLEHDKIRPSLDLIEHNGKIDIHSVSLYYK